MKSIYFWFVLDLMQSLLEWQQRDSHWLLRWISGVFLQCLTEMWCCHDPRLEFGIVQGQGTQVQGEGNWQQRKSSGKGLRFLSLWISLWKDFLGILGEDVTSQGLGQAETLMRVTNCHCSGWLFLHHLQSLPPIKCQQWCRFTQLLSSTSDFSRIFLINFSAVSKLSF